LIAVVDRGDLLFGERVAVSDPSRFVRDVFLVERRRTRGLLPGESALVTLGGSRGFVRSRRGYVGEERLVLRRRPLHEVRRLAGEHVREEVLGLSTVRDLLAILVEAVIVQLLVLELAVPLIPAWWRGGRVFRGIPVQVLAEESSPVASLLKANADRILLVPLGEELLKPSIWRPVASHVVVVLVETSEDGRPRGTT
jgi:hypothetical protein